MQQACLAFVTCAAVARILEFLSNIRVTTRMLGNIFTAPAATVAFAGVALLMLAAPFELTQPLLRLPRQSVSNLEAALLLAVVSFSLAVIGSYNLPRWQTPLTLPWLALLAATLVASAASPVSRLNAFHMTGRLCAAFAVFLLTINAVTTRARLRIALELAMAAGVAVSAIALLEYLRVRVVLDALKAFRPGMTVVGAQLRAGGPLQYPTIASMYLEVVFAFGLGLLLLALDRSRPIRVAVLFAALLLIAEAITLTFTRAGLITMGTSLVVVGVVRQSQRGNDAGIALLVALAVLVAGLFAASRSTESMWLRLTSEGQESWYRAKVDAPANVEFSTGRTSNVPVNVTNTGRLMWDSHSDPPFFLSYHWLQADGDRFVAFEGARTGFTSPVAPDATVSVLARVRAPGRPGRYRLEWDVVQEGRLWFSTEPGATRMISPATVTGPPFDDPARLMAPPRPTVRPGRLVLWRAAARMLAAHPWLGVGPDNFRLTYGEYARLPAADPRLHSNNMYVEMFTGGGLIAGAAFLWLVWRAGGSFVRGVRASDNAAAIGIAAAGLAIALHGFVDSFVSFAPTYILISLTLGLAAACARGLEASPDAHRV
jgi:O-antigen ligase